MKNYNFVSLFVERIASSCFAVARFCGFFACAGVVCRGPPRDLDTVGSTQYNGYYFTKEIIAGEDCFTKETIVQVSGSKTKLRSGV